MTDAEMKNDLTNQTRGNGMTFEEAAKMAIAGLVGGEDNFSLKCGSVVLTNDHLKYGKWVVETKLDINDPDNRRFAEAAERFVKESR